MAYSNFYGDVKEALNVSDTVSIDASGSGDVTITVPDGKRYLIKSITITKDADITISGITVDGEDTGEKDSFDALSEFGDFITADVNIKVSASNAGTAAENITVTVKGIIVNK